MHLIAVIVSGGLKISNQLTWLFQNFLNQLSASTYIINDMNAFQVQPFTESARF